MAKPKKPPKISDQSFTKMVEALLGAKVHLDYATKVQEKGKDLQHLHHAFEYLEVISTHVEVQISRVTEALKVIQNKSKAERMKKMFPMKIRSEHGRPAKKK